jgi:hypothetical protein
MGVCLLALIKSTQWQPEPRLIGGLGFFIAVLRALALADHRQSFGN